MANRISQAVVEVIRAGTGHARVSQAVVEILRSTSAVTTAATINVSGSTGINFEPYAGCPRILAVSASNGLQLSVMSSGARATRTLVATASSTVNLAGPAQATSLAGAPKFISASASTGISLSTGAAAGGGHVSIASASTGIKLSSSATGGRFVYHTVTASSGITLSVSTKEYTSPLHVSAATGLSFAASSSGSATLAKIGSATSAVVLNPQADADGQIRTLSVSGFSGIAVSPTSDASQERLVNVSATTSIRVYSNIAVAGARNVQASTSVGFSVAAAKNSSIGVSASSLVNVSPLATKNGRVVNVSATTSMGMTSIDPLANRSIDPEGLNTVAFEVSASGSVGYTGALSSISFGGYAVASVELPSGGSVPGGDANAGLRAVAYPSVSSQFPMSFAETPSGLVIIANGVDPMLRWDGLSGITDTVGVVAPSTPLALAGQNVGTLVGMRWAYVRFVDRYGNPSSLSPISNAVNLGRDALIEGIAISPTTGVVTVQSSGHGLDASDVVVIQDVVGVSINGQQAIAVIDSDHFALVSPTNTSSVWQGGGSWTWGVAEVVYGSVPVPLDQKVIRRQILRNLDGVADVFYVDIDTTDVISGTLTSTRTDESLSACESVPISTTDEIPYASRYYPPPSHKAIVASHAGRMFACGEVTITQGNVLPVFGSGSISGVGTAWTTSLAGRYLYVDGASAPYEIASVNPATQTIALVTNYADPTMGYATYSIRPAPGERRLVYYSEPGLPEAWPPWNAFAIPEENDEIVGMMTRTGFLYFVEKRHIHRFTMQSEPSEGQDFASINRGCINGRCFVQVENTSYMLDEAGIHAFDGGQATEPISTPIQTIFQADGLLGGLMVDWSADSALWHAVHDPVRNTIRWFVQMVGYDGIYHAISYDHRQQRWWIEQYPAQITSSTTGIVGYRRPLVGSDARRVIVLGEGSLDFVADSGPNYGGLVTSADSTSLTDSTASFPSNLEGAPVSITNGTGRGQQAIICSNTSTSLEVVEPWETVPDSSSYYQVGGVNWSWRSGWFDLAIEEEDTNSRDVSVTYQPTTSPATMDVQLFFDHSETPQDWADYLTSQDGVTVLPGDPNVTISLQGRQCRSGWSLQRFAGHSSIYGYGSQYLQILVAGVQASESVRIFQITLNGVRSEA